MQDPTVITRRAAREEYNELISFLDLAFGFDEASGFLPMLPKLYKPEFDPCPKNRIISSDGVIRAAVGEYDSLLSVGGTLLKCRGIGNVATHPDCRGKGYMTELMKASVTDMCRSDIDLSMLGGKQERYSRFGYESLGLEYRALITEASIRRAAVQPDGEVSLAIVTPDNGDLIEKIYSLHCTRPLRTVRDRDSFFDICSSWNTPTVAVTKGGECVGYFTGDLFELTLTDDSLFDTVVYGFTRARGDVTLSIPMWDKRMIAQAKRVSESCECGASYMFNIINYERVLSAFLTFAASLAPLPDISFTALIHGIRCDEQLKITVSGGHTSVETSSGVPDIELEHADAMRFFFGKDSPERDALPAAAHSIFPLPIYIERADHV